MPVTYSFVLFCSHFLNFPVAQRNSLVLTKFHKQFSCKLIILQITDSSVTLFQADALLGCAMTYTLFEYIKEEAESLTEEQPDAPPVQVSSFLQTYTGMRMLGIFLCALLLEIKKG